MHRADDSKYLLFIEPKASEKSDYPEYERYANIIQDLIENHSEKGTSFYSDLNDSGQFVELTAYKGLHFADDGKISTNVDYLLPTGHITNSLAPHYVRHYWGSVPETERQKVCHIVEWYDHFSRSEDEV